jgi:hypothetical protein
MQLRVSGNSPVLKWLLEASSEMTPWLHLEDRGLRIDWESVMQRWRPSSRSAALPASLSRALPRLLPEWPLASLFELDSPAWQHDDRALCASITVEPEPIAGPAVRVLDGLGDEVDQLLERIDEVACDDARLETARRCLRSLREATTERHLRRTLSIRYHAIRRLVVAKADMRIFLKGSTALVPHAVGADRHRRQESWRLARGLVRAHLDLHERLEDMVRSGVPDDSAPLAKGPLAESWRHIGHLERKLARSLTSPLKPDGSGRACGFASIQVDFDDIESLEGRGPAQSGHDAFGTRHLARGSKASPFVRILALLDETSAILLALERHVAETNGILAQFKAAANAAKSTLGAHALEVAKPSALGIDARDLDEVIEWLIAESPLLTLLAGGFLSAYRENPERYGICLSPWLAATLTARRQVGPLPMTYLGVDPSSDMAHDEDDSAEAEAAAKSPRMTGRGIWELFG